MSTYDESKHPRGQAQNAGQFRTKENDMPTSGLEDRAARLARAEALECELRKLTRDRARDEGTLQRIAQLEAEVAAAYARPGRKAPPLTTLGLSPRNRTAMSFLVGERDDHLDLNPPYQRGSVWTVAERRALIESIRRGIPIGSVTINDRWETNGYQGPIGYACVDGKQRIETIRAFFADEFSVPADWFEDDEIADEGPDGEIVYSQLTLRGQRRAENWPIPTLEARVPTIEDEARLYGLVNSGGVAQTNADLANARRVASS